MVVKIVFVCIVYCGRTAYHPTTSVWKMPPSWQPDTGQATLEVIGSKRSYTLKWIGSSSVAFCQLEGLVSSGGPPATLGTNVSWLPT